MDVMEKFGEKLNQAGKGMQTWLDTSQINRMIEEERSKQKQIFSQLGEMYYRDICEDPPERYAGLVKAMKDSEDAVNGYLKQIDQLKKRKYCKVCNTYLDADARFCPQCGSEVTNDTEEQKCPNCGGKIEADDMYCALCGKKLK